MQDRLADWAFFCKHMGIGMEGLFGVACCGLAKIIEKQLK